MALPTIACKDCGHVNEGERVYCHNCGAKLDRTVLLTEQQQKQESYEDRKKRIHKMMNPNAGLFVGAWKSLLKAVGAGAIVAALINMAMPPEAVPPMPKKGELPDSPQIGMLLENMTMNPAPMRIALQESEINNYLKSSVRMKKDNSFAASILTFQRAFVNLQDNVCNITLQNGLYDYPTYMTIGYNLSIRNHKIVGNPVSIHLGRLALPAIAAPYVAPMFQPLWDVMHREHSLMDKLQSVEVKKGSMILTSAPQAH